MEMPKPVGRKVSRLRWMVRTYLLLEGVAALVIVFGFAYWFGLAIDWLFEPSPSWRIVQWTGVLVAAFYVAFHYLIARLFRRLSDMNLALLLERTYPELREGLGYDG